MAPTLRLVESFSEYGFPRIDDLLDSQNAIERGFRSSHIQSALDSLGITDYKIIQDAEKIVTYLKSEEDLNKLSLRMAKKEELEPYEFWTADPDYDVRKLKRNTRKLQDTVDQTFLRGSVSIIANRAARSMALVAESRVAESLFKDIFLEEIELAPARYSDFEA